MEKTETQIWHLIDPPHPMDEKRYDIHLRDGSVVEDVEYLAYFSGFSTGEENKPFIKKREVLSFRMR